MNYVVGNEAPASPGKSGGCKNYLLIYPYSDQIGIAGSVPFRG